MTPPAVIEEDPILALQYETGHLWLTARDPHTLHVTWDLTLDQAKAAGDRLAVRVRELAAPTHNFQEIRVGPQGRSAFVRVEAPGSRYGAEIGFPDAAGVWQCLASATPVTTPAQRSLEAAEPRFVTVTIERAEPQLATGPAPEARPADAPRETHLPAAAAPAVPPGASPEPVAAGVPPLGQPGAAETPPRPRGEPTPPTPAPPSEAAVSAPAQEPPSAVPAMPPPGPVGVQAEPKAGGGEPVVPSRAGPEPTALAWLAPVPAAPGAAALPPSGGEPIAAGMPPEARLEAPATGHPSSWVSPPAWHVRLVEVTVPPLPPEAVTALRALTGFHVTTEELPSSAALAMPGAPAFGPGPTPTVWGPAGPRELGLPSSLSLPARPGPGVGRRGFWFNVNAELIVYGATEPDAQITIDGEPVALRPDGSFTLRFALPDGDYALSALAVSAAGDDSRSARLEFLRRTAYRGQVGKHPTDPALKPPAQKGPA